MQEKLDVSEKKWYGKLMEDAKVAAWSLKMGWDIDKKGMFFWLLVNIGGALMPVFFLAATRKIVNTITMQTQSGGSFSSITAWVVALGMFLFLKSIYDMLPNILYYIMHIKYGVGMQKKMGNWVRTMPLKMFDDHEMAKKIDLTMSGVRTALPNFMQRFMRCISTLIGVIGLLVLCIRTSTLMFGVAIFLMSLIIPVGTHNAFLSRNFWKNERENERTGSYLYQLVFDHNLAREYRTLGLDSFIRGQWAGIVRPMHDRFVNFYNKRELVWSMLTIASTLFKFVIIFIGLYIVKSGSISLGGFIMFASLFDQLSSSSVNLGRSFMNIYDCIYYIEMQKELLEFDFDAPKTADRNIHPTPNADGKAPVVFEMKDVSYCYEKDKYALKNISMLIRKGEIVALVGSNGAGKSTFIKMLLGFYEPTEGQMYFQGKNYCNIDNRELLEKIGVTFQDYAKFEFTLRENIAFGDLTKLNDDDNLYDAARKGGAEKVINRMFNGINTQIGRWYESKGTQLSGGEWQRIAVSRAHLSDREILIMDEPAAMLDPIAEMEQFNNIRYTVEDRTAILISHRIGFARLADKIIVLDEGKLAEFGTHDELMSKEGKYYEMFRTQAEWYTKEGVV